MTRESKRTLEAVVELLKADRVTRTEATKQLHRMQDRIANICEVLAESGAHPALNYTGIREERATLCACAAVLRRAVRELPEAYVASDRKATLEAIVEMLKGDRVTRAAAEDRAREMREHMAQLQDEMHDMDWKNCDELQETWDVLNACETVLYRAARELPEAYEIDEAELRKMHDAAQDILDAAEVEMVRENRWVEVNDDLIQAVVRDETEDDIQDAATDAILFDEIWFAMHEVDGPRYEELEGDALYLADEAMRLLGFRMDEGIVADVTGGKFVDAVRAYYEPMIIDAWKRQKANEEARDAIDRMDWAEGLTDEEAERVDEDMERASNGSAVIGLQLRYQEARRIRDEREQAARDWLEEWFEGAEDPEAPVVRKDEDEDEAPWDVVRREREAKAAEDAARRAGKDHLMLIDDSNIGQAPAIEYRAVRDFWTGSDEELRELSREGYVLVTLISRDMIEEEGFGDAGENGRLDIWFRPSRQAYVPRAEYDREVERLRAEADVARAAGAKAGWEAAESAYRNSLDYFELMKRSWKDRDDSPYPPEN